MTVTAIHTRMYNVGFGDAFLVVFDRDTGPWRMLIDCGAHSSGSSGHKIAEIVDRIITDISPDGGAPHLDVVVATHRHRDHVSGFESERWKDVTVGEVWLPFTENPKDRLGRRIRNQQAKKAHRLHTYLIGLAAAGDNDAQLAARVVENSLENAKAMHQLNHGFDGKPRRRYFPNPDIEPKAFEPAGLPEATIHMLGPRRDEATIAKMEPPADQHWLRQIDPTTTDPTLVTGPLFAEPYEVNAPTIRDDAPDLYLTDTERTELATDATLDAWTAAGSITSGTNNTSLVFVIEIGEAKLLFAGDAEWPLWNAILDDTDATEVLTDTRLYKVGHHGSHNASHKRYVQDLMGPDTTSLMSFHAVKNWPSIPNPALIDALDHGPRTLIRSDRPATAPDVRWDGTVVAEHTITLD